MSTPHLTTVPTVKRGRPRNIKTIATNLIGVAGVSALERADLFIVSGALVRELALIIQEPVPPQPETKETNDPDNADRAVEG